MRRHENVYVLLRRIILFYFFISAMFCAILTLSPIAVPILGVWPRSRFVFVLFSYVVVSARYCDERMRNGLVDRKNHAEPQCVAPSHIVGSP